MELDTVFTKAQAANENHDEGERDVYKALVSLQRSLQREKTEVDLEKEIDLEWAKCNPIDEGVGVETANIHIEQFDAIARHFYKLGLNAGEK